MYWRSSGPNRSSANRRCPTTGKLRRIACCFCVTSCAATAPTPQRHRPRPASISWWPCLASGRLGVDPPRGDGTTVRNHGSGPEARSGRLGGQQRGAQGPLRRTGRPAADAADPDRRGRRSGRSTTTGPPPPRAEQGDPVLLVTPLAAPALCFDLRRGCSLVEHFVEAGRPTYLVEYGEVSFKNRALGIEHWIDEVVPTAVEEVSKHAGRTAGPPGRLEPGRDLQPARRRRPPRPPDRLGHRGRVAGRRHAGAAGRPAATAAELQRRPAAHAASTSCWAALRSRW